MKGTPAECIGFGWSLKDLYVTPFTPPLTNQSTFHQWTIGPIYYSTLVMAEALGTTGSTQVMDLSVNDGNNYTPAYAIYKNNIPICVALINFMTDNSGTSAYTMSISISGGNTGQPTSTPSSVKVKYLSTSNVSQKASFTWAGQTFGDYFASDGRPMGEESIQTIQCNLISNTCQISVPAPGFTLVFLNDKALEESTDGGNGEGGEVMTKMMNTATIDQEVLATSNGHRAGDLVGWMGSMSRRSSGVQAGRGVKGMDMSMVVMGMISMQVVGGVLLGGVW
ncbi:hypothetical protein D9758_012929 [Tetrapyrgos nigripes]|uniref:Beta-glucuronidase C-terminal domain-containing protein n=1 Tax=Tetrapyrgos nigripes TaxID=182062 RepID=A0A8H5CLM9_9AGAR|nr:hypothetical protein D9758_012929 [Tetrapyrgos nigripes]